MEIIFLNQPTLGDSPQDQLLLNTQGAFAEYERVVISDRIRRGQLYRPKQGQSVPRPAPYGYQYQTATAPRISAWVVDEAEAVIVEQMFDWYTAENLSLMAACNRLNDQNIPSPDGKRWWSNSVGRLLRQPADKGTACLNRSQVDYSGIGFPRRQSQGRLQFPRSKPRSADEWTCVPVPTIVSEATWQVAQERLERNAKLSKRSNRQHTYLLKSLLVCGRCGRTLQG